MSSPRLQQGTYALSPAVLVAVAVAMSFCAAVEASTLTAGGAMSMPEQAVLATQNGRQAVTRLVGRLHDAARTLLRHSPASDRTHASAAPTLAALPAPLPHLLGGTYGTCASLTDGNAGPAGRAHLNAFYLALPPPVV